MAAIGVPVITAPGIPADASRPLPVRDGALSGVANAGVRFMFDLAFPWSYPGGSPIGRPAAGNPAAGASVQDMTERANGQVSLGAIGSVLAYSGGGFDFTNSDVSGGAVIKSGVIAPAGTLADLFAPYGGKSQRFMIVDYVKLPSKANWNAAATILGFAMDDAFNVGPSLVNMVMATGYAVQARRQTAAGAASQISVTPNDADFGTVCQIAVWRTDAEMGIRLKSLTSGAAAAVATAAVGADNTQDFSNSVFAFGRHSTFSGPGAGVVSAVAGYRQHRGWIENLARSARNPIAVLDADFTRQQTRNPFS